MNKKYKVGLVGYGYIGRSHVNTIISLNKYFELKVIFENKMIKKNIDELPRNVKIYKEFLPKFIPDELDMVIICAPT